MCMQAYDAAMMISAEHRAGERTLRRGVRFFQNLSVNLRNNASVWYCDREDAGPRRQPQYL